jgi:glycosyltransferase involved in cell wall biosynthesis
MTHKKPFFSILTPTFNRAQLLTRLYQSLLHSECLDFEWIVIDDGSTDDTERAVQDFISSGNMNIRYFKKLNGGKHTALNIGFLASQGELILILDSDDTIPPSSLNFAQRHWERIKVDKSCAGIIGLCSDMNTQEIIGDAFSCDGNYSTITKNNFYFNLKGDKCDFIRTAYIKNLKFPVIEGQKFIPESIVTYELDRNYRYYCVNQSLKLVEYQTEGITNNFLTLTLKNADGYFLRFKHLADTDFLQQMSLKGKLVILSNYFRYLFHSKNNLATEVSSLKKLGFLSLLLPCAFFIGVIYFFKDIIVKKRAL